MRAFVTWLVDHTTTVLLAVAVLSFFGMLAYLSLPRESQPDISIPVVLVTTPYPGVSPADIEELISTPLEDELSSLSDVKRLSSSSAEGFSVVSVEFEPTVDLDEAVQKVRDRVGRARPELPDDVEEPTVREINFSDLPVLLVTLSGPDEAGLVELSDKLVEDLGAVLGVLDAKVSGGVERQIRVQIDPLRLAHYGLSLDDVNGAIANENVNIPGGNVTTGAGDLMLRVPGTFADPREIEGVAIKRVGDQPVFVRDVATVLDDRADRTTYSRLGNAPSVTISVTKRPGANIIDVADAVKALAAEHATRWPEGHSYRILADQSEQIASTVSELENNIITALLLVVGVIFVFMGARSSLFVAVTIPLSMLFTFLVLQVLGFTLNMIVLFSLILALGMLVDNAIVVVENVYRHLELGADPREAAIKGTSEVGIAIIASTATTVAAFLPLVFWTGIMGEFMGFLPKTVIIVLTASLVAALVVLPPVLVLWLPRKVTIVEEVELRDRPLGRGMSAYRTVLRWSIRYPWVSALAGVAALLFSFVVYGLLNHGTEFFPATDPERAVVAIRLPDGATLDSTDRVARAVEAFVASEPEVDTWVTEVGVSGAGNPLMGASAAPNEARITVNFKPDANSAERGEIPRSGSTTAAVDRLRHAVEVIPGAAILVNPEAMGPPVGKPIEVLVSGEDFHAVGELASEVRRELAKLEGATDLSDNYRVGRPELRLEVDRGAARRVGVSTAQVGNVVRNAVAGAKVSSLRDGDEDVDIVVEVAPAFRQDLQSILALRLPGRVDTSPDTFPVPVSSVATWELRGGSGAIQHLDQDLVITITGDVAVGYNQNEVQGRVKQLLEAYEPPEGMHLAMGGSNDDQKESQDFLGRAFLIAVALIAVVLVGQFDSITTPLIVLTSVLLSLIGVLWGLLLTGTAFGVIMTGLGVISLAGVVVNNAIVLLDYVEQLRARGIATEDALVEAGLTRFRPVMLTAITTVLGLVPMALGVSFDFLRFKVLIGGASAQWWGPMAVAVIFGLSFATLLTLVMVPTLYQLFEQLRGLGRRVWRPAVAAAASASALVLLVPVPADALTLDEAWDAAERHSIQLQASVEQQVQVGTNRGRALAALSPQVDARVSYVLNQREIAFDMADNFPPEILALMGDVELGEPTVIQQKDFWQGEVGVSQRLFSGAALPGYRSAVLLTQAAGHDLRQTRSAVREQVASSFFGLQAAKESVDLSQASLDAAAHREGLAVKQVDAGLAPPRALTQAKLDVAVARRQLEESRRQLIEAEEGFASLTGLRGAQPEGGAPLAAPASAEAALDQARAQRGDIAGSQARIRAVEWERTARDLRWLPVVDGRFAYLYDQNTGFNSFEWNWRASVTASWVLWDGGLRLADHRETASRVRSAELAERAAMQQAELEIRVAWEGLALADRAVEAGAEERRLAEENLQLAERSFEGGGATWLDVEQAQLQARAAALAELLARQQRDLAAIRLAGATGAL